MGGMSEEVMKKMVKIINYLMSKPDSGPFREPVDWKNLDLYDYPKIVKRPMDLGTVKRKLERDQYTSASECAADIRLIWTNCKTYNADGSDFYLLAESFSKRFEDRYKKIETDCKSPCSSCHLSCHFLQFFHRCFFCLHKVDLGENEKKKSSTTQPKSGAVSLDVKARFASSIFRLSGMELGHVLQVIDLKCPNALELPDPSKMPQSQNEPAGVEINVDAIDARTFAELDRYVKEKMLARTTGEALDELDGGSKSTKRQKR
jgi:hypothetical protein